MWELDIFFEPSRAITPIKSFHLRPGGFEVLASASPAMSHSLKPAAQCQFDQLSLGEVIPPLDPGETRIRTTRAFTAWEGGGEYNVARGLRKCFGLRTAGCTAFGDNEVGHLIEDFILQG